MDFVGRESLPDAEVFEDGFGGVGERDFAAVVGRVGKHLRLVHFDDADVKRAARERAAEGEAGGAGANDDDIGLFLHGFLRDGKAMRARL